MQFLKQSTTVTIQMGPFLDSTDGITAEIALTLTPEVSRAGAAFGARSSATAISHDADGWYRVELNATDTATLGTLIVKDVQTGAIPVWHEFTVVPANIYDTFIGGTDVLQADVTQIDGLATSGNNATLNLKQLNIVNSTGSALVATSTGSNGHGITASGNGAGAGLRATGGATGQGIWGVGGVTSGSGLVGTSSNGAGMSLVAGGNQSALSCTGAGSGSGIRAMGGATGTGLYAAGGGTSGMGAHFTAQNGDGIGLLLSGNGVGEGLYCIGGATGNGAEFVGGATSGDGLRATATAGSKALGDEAVDSILDRAVTEPSAVFTWPASLRTIAQFLGALARNKITQTSTTQTLRNDADSGTIATSTQSDDGTTFTRNEFS